MPSWADISLPILSPYFKLLWGFQYDPTTAQFSVRLAGDKFRKWTVPNYDGAELKDLALLANGGQLQQYLIEIISRPAAFRSSGHLFSTGEIVVTGERISLPLADDGKTGDGILGASDFVSPPLLGPVELVHENVTWCTL